MLYYGFNKQMTQIYSIEFRLNQNGFISEDEHVGKTVKVSESLNHVILFRILTLCRTHYIAAVNSLPSILQLHLVPLQINLPVEIQILIRDGPDIKLTGFSTLMLSRIPDIHSLGYRENPDTEFNGLQDIGYFKYSVILCQITSMLDIRPNT